MPQVVGFKLTGKLREGATATDLVLTVTEMLRKLGVVGKFVEFYGAGITELSLADRATIGNMAPEYGATCGIFPVDAETLRYLRLTGRSEEQIELVEAYYKEQGLFHTPDRRRGRVLADHRPRSRHRRAQRRRPRRPQDRVLLKEAGASFKQQLPSLARAQRPTRVGERQVDSLGGRRRPPVASTAMSSQRTRRRAANGNGHDRATPSKSASTSTSIPISTTARS